MRRQIFMPRVKSRFQNLGYGCKDAYLTVVLRMLERKHKPALKGKHDLDTVPFNAHSLAVFLPFRSCTSAYLQSGPTFSLHCRPTDVNTRPQHYIMKSSH